jgi:NAD(P)-dependent dehydrogenase (short-subunit alcohol dehydrogenase family)
VSDDAQVAAMVDRTVAEFGRLDAAFNNAGVMASLAPIADRTREDWDRVIGINLRGVWGCMKRELRHMESHGSGAIVNNASVGALTGNPGIASYIASKHGVVGLSRTAALEYVKRGIRVNAVNPGLIDTQIVRFEDRETPKIVDPTDAVIRIAVTCICGSDLWPYRRLQPIDGPMPMGHEYCGTVEEVGSAVKSIKPGQFVVGSFATSDNTCPHCLYGYQSSCVHREFMNRAQAPVLRVPLADGTLVPTPGVPSDRLLPSLLTTSDVLGTGWFAADAANVKPGSTVAVVGDGAVGLLDVLSAKQMGAERIIAMSRHEKRQKLALEFGATDIVTEGGDEGVARRQCRSARLRRHCCRRHLRARAANPGSAPTAGFIRRTRSIPMAATLRW